jgi:7-cyano-7-deazaguanine synthase
VSQVTLVSGGIDSTLMAVMANEERIRQHPLFIDYGQLSAKREWKACRSNHHKFGLPKPAYTNLGGFGKLIPSGLTDRRARINEDAFLPGRNLLFLLVGASYAYRVKANSVAIGLLSDTHRIFPDQTASFVNQCEALLKSAMDYKVKLVTPLMHLTKRDSIELARLRGITGTYSCHAGRDEPCGLCVSCKEIENTQEGGV